MGCDGEIDDILRIRLREVGSDEVIFTSMAWIRAFNINEPIYAKLYHEFYSTYEFDEVCADDELQLGLYQVEKLKEEAGQVRGRRIQNCVPRVGSLRPPRESMQDLYDSMGRMEIRQDAIEQMGEPTTHLVMLNHSMTSTISTTSLRHHNISSKMMTSSVEMA
uniref:Uncharacterized protein n=1 Tax=Tanacetum cinerariifolium TaxID=118510 RepID=A0A699HR60_TANCI|nr:hypothetical protein [Tanacetum cinerariifolium]